MCGCFFVPCVFSKLVDFIFIESVLVFIYLCNFLYIDCWGRLTGIDIVCSEDPIAVFNCSINYSTVIEWRVSSICGSGNFRESFSRNDQVGYTRYATLCSTTLMFTVTSLTSSSISVTLTIHTPVLLNGTRITCGGQTVTLDVLSSKIFLVIMKIMIKKAKHGK